MNTEPLSANFRDIILCFIHIAQKSKEKAKEYHIDQAIAYSKLWCKKCKSKINESAICKGKEEIAEAYFYDGVIKVIKALQIDNQDMIMDAKRQLDKSKKNIHRNERPCTTQEYRKNPVF